MLGNVVAAVGTGTRMGLPVIGVLDDGAGCTALCGTFALDPATGIVVGTLADGVGSGCMTPVATVASGIGTAIGTAVEVRGAGVA